LVEVAVAVEETGLVVHHAELEDKVVQEVYI
jgi:hypothetical protein